MEESTFLDPTRALRAAQLHEGMQVADFGAGSGFFTRAAAREVGEHGVVWAVDGHADLLARVKNIAAAEGLKNVEVLRGNLERAAGSNLPAGQFDLVIAANLLFSLEHKKICLEEVYRVLRPGGRVLLVDWKDSFSGLGPHPDHIVPEEVARQLCAAAGLTVVAKVPAGEYHWGFIARKKTAQGAQ